MSFQQLTSVRYSTNELYSEQSYIQSNLLVNYKKHQKLNVLERKIMRTMKVNDEGKLYNNKHKGSKNKMAGKQTQSEVFRPLE